MRVRSSLHRVQHMVPVKRGKSKWTGGTKAKLKRKRAPKPIAPPKPDRPKRSLLKRLYRGLISADVDQRIDTLKRALQWYDQALAYVAYKQKGVLTKDQLRAQVAAHRARSFGMNEERATRKEKHYLDAVVNSEAMVAVYRPPTVAKFIARLTADKVKLADRQARLKDKHGRFLELMSKALEPKSITGEPIELRVGRMDAPYRIDSECQVTFDRRTVMMLRKVARRLGLFGAILNAMPVISEAAALVPERDIKGHRTGRMEIDWKRRWQASMKMMNTLMMWVITADEAPRKLVRRPSPKKETKEEA